MLGTGNAMVTECYNTCFVIEEDNQYFMVDGGGGNTILQQLKTVGLNWKDIKHIFVTHKHIDHLLGIIWMIRVITQNMNQNQYKGDTYIYAHDEVIDIIKEMSQKLLTSKQSRFLGTRLHLVTLKDGQQFNVISHTFTAFDIQSTKAKQFGFTMNYGDNQKLTCCGDEPYNDCEYEYAKESDWLLHEAFCLASEADIFKPYEKHHSTVKDACELAEKLNVKNLVLYHTEDKNIHNREVLYKSEGEQHFHGKLWIPNDLTTIVIE